VVHSQTYYISARVWVEGALVGALFYEIVHNNNRERKCHTYIKLGGGIRPPQRKKKRLQNTVGTEGKDYCCPRKMGAWQFGRVGWRIIHSTGTIGAHRKVLEQFGPYGGGRQKTTANGTSKLLNDSLRMVNLLLALSAGNKKRINHNTRLATVRQGGGGGESS
jgi:hypothetical protein